MIHSKGIRDAAQYLQNQVWASKGSVQLHLSVDLSVTALAALISLAHILTIILSTKPRHEFQCCAILTSERAQVPSRLVLSPALAAKVAVAVVQFVVQSPRDVDVAGQTGLDNVNSLACRCCTLQPEAVR